MQPSDNVGCPIIDWLLYTVLEVTSSLPASHGNETSLSFHMNQEVHVIKLIKPCAYMIWYLLNSHHWGVYPTNPSLRSLHLWMSRSPSKYLPASLCLWNNSNGGIISQTHSCTPPYFVMLNYQYFILFYPTHLPLYPHSAPFILLSRTELKTQSFNSSPPSLLLPSSLPLTNTPFLACLSLTLYVNLIVSWSLFIFSIWMMQLFCCK